MGLKRVSHRYDSSLKYSFLCFGHPNIRAKHSKTIEFTKDTEITSKADCIIGINSDFDLEQLKKFCGKILLTIECDSLFDEFHAIVNRSFDDSREMVLRKGRFISKRTFAVMLNKGADGLKREIVEKMRDAGQNITVTVFQKPVVKLPYEEGRS